MLGLLCFLFNFQIYLNTKQQKMSQHAEKKMYRSLYDEEIGQLVRHGNSSTRLEPR